MSKLSITVPAHNEEKRIGPMLDSYLSYFRKVKDKGFKFEIVIVLNACTDNTRKVIESRKAKEVRLIEFTRGGKGFAVMEGIKDALKRDSSAIGFVDADGATSPEAFHRLLCALGNNDGVVASRYIKGSVMNPRPTLQRFIFSRMYNAVIRAMFVMPYRDTQCGAKIFARHAAELLAEKIHMTQWAFDIEMLYEAKKAGMHIEEVPTVWSDKEYSNVNALTAGPMMLLGIIRLRILHSPFRRLIRVYDFGADIARKAIKR